MLIPSAYYEPGIFAFLVISAFVTGCCIGSFLNVCIWRIPRGESIITPPSHCPKCGHMIRAVENIPILSYIFLAGKCSCCRGRISPRYIIVEFSTGIIFAAIFFKCMLQGELFPGYFIMASILIVCALTDCELGIIPDAVTYFGIICGIIIPLFSLPDLKPLLHILFSTAFTALLMSSVALLGKAIFKREALGWGDVKFITAGAALTGMTGAFFMVFAGSAAGLAGHAALSIIKKRRRKTLKFGPYLAFGALLWMLCGELIMSSFIILNEKIITSLKF